MSDEDNKTDQENHEIFHAASVAHFRDPRRFRTLGILIAAGIAFILVLSGAAYLLKEKPALVVGKYSYNQSEYAKLIQQAAVISVKESDARFALTKGFASREAADRLKVTYPIDTASLNEAARYEYKINPDSATKISDYQRATSIYRIVEANIRFAAKGGYKVSVVHLPFARYIYGFEASSKTAENGSIDLIGNDTAIARDMGYAAKKGEELRTDYDSKKMTYAQVAQAALDDPVMSYGRAKRPSNQLLVMSDGALMSYGDKDVTTYLQTDQFNKIQEYKGQIGKVSTLSEELVDPEGLPANPYIMRGDKVAVGYYFVIVDSVEKPKATIQVQYDKTLKELQ